MLYGPKWTYLPRALQCDPPLPTTLRKVDVICSDHHRNSGANPTRAAVMIQSRASSTLQTHSPRSLPKPSPSSPSSIIYHLKGPSVPCTLTLQPDSVAICWRTQPPCP